MYRRSFHFIDCIFAQRTCKNTPSCSSFAGGGSPVYLDPWRSPMLYAVLFEDNPSLGSDVRRKHMAAHLAFLEKNAAQIKAAGPLRALGGDPAGGFGSSPPTALGPSMRL
jgi:hypothetical protein